MRDDLVRGMKFMTFEGRGVNELHKDEDLRARNFDSFEKRYGFRPRVGAGEDKQYRIEAAIDGGTVLYIRNASAAGDLRLNSVYSPEYETSRWAEKFDMLNRRTTVALLGFSNGDYLKTLLKRLRPDTVFFVFEPDEELFSFICSYIDITEIISEKRIKLYISDEQRGLYAEEMIHDVSTVRPETIKIVTPFYSENEAFDEACESISRIMSSNNAFQRGRSRKTLRARLYAWNRMQNAYFLPELAKVLPKSIPAVIVSAGPSLRKNVQELKKIKNRALIICTDRAAAVLDEHGIVPDFVSSFDAEKNPDFLQYDVLKDVPLICSYQLNIEAQKMFRNRMLFMHALSYENRLFEGNVGGREKGVDLGGNVAGGSFVACEMLGINTIILVGQDLAYLDGKHHADDRTDGMPLDGAVEAEGIDGKTVLTTGMWLIFRDFFERQMSLFPNLRVIDATEGGLLIRGSEVMTLNEVAETVCTREYDLGSILNKMDKAQGTEGHNKTVEVLKSWISDLDMISKNSGELGEICNQMVNECKYHDITNPKLYNRFRRIETLINEFLPTQAYKMLKEFWIEDMYSIPDNNFMVRNNEEALPVFENASEFYTNLPKDCESLKQEIEKSIEEGEAENE